MIEMVPGPNFAGENKVHTTAFLQNATVFATAT